MTNQIVLANQILVYICCCSYKDNVYYYCHVILQLPYEIFLEYVPEICSTILPNI